MPLVRPTLRSDVTKLMSAFQFGYRAGSATLYVSTTNEAGDNRFILAKDRREWGELWNAENDKFESLLRKDKDLMSLSGCMFFVYDGNHRLLELPGRNVSNQITRTMHFGTRSMVAQNVSSWTQRVGVGTSLTQCTTSISKYDSF